MYFKVTHKQTKELLRLSKNTLREGTNLVGTFFRGYFTQEGLLYYGVRGRTQYYVDKRGGEVLEIFWEDFKENVLDRGKVLEEYNYKDLGNLYIENEEAYSSKGLSEKEVIADKIYRWHNSLAEQLEDGTYGEDEEELEDTEFKAVYSHVRDYRNADPFELPIGAFWYQWEDVKGEMNLNKKVACAYCGDVNKARDMFLSDKIVEENINRWLIGQFAVCEKCNKIYEGMFGDRYEG